ncbi:MAG TPA: ABC transporter permease [Thermoanaerobaculia bacterium]|nr:ABC transporter permease [Thermoanaerobaculia bacterium]
MHPLQQDLRSGLRLIAQKPGLAAVSILTFALGIGLTTAMFSIVMGGMADLPFEESDRLVHLEEANLPLDDESIEVPPHDFLDWRNQQKSFEDLAGFSTGTMNLAAPGDRPQRFSGGFVTPNVFNVLRVGPILGRSLQAADSDPSAEPVVLLGHSVWTNRFGADPAIVGRRVRVNSQERTIVGVMPEGFLFPFREHLWVPLVFDLTNVKRGEGQTLEVIGRLKPGVSLEQARAEMGAVAQQLAAAYPETNKDVSVVAKPFTHEYIDDEPRSMLWAMLAAVILVLIIACINVANLLIARTAARSKEIAVRSTLGASRGRLVAQILIEALVLASLGALLGLTLAVVGIDVFNRAIVDTEPPFWIDIKLDAPVLLFSLAMTLLAALMAGAIPALRATGKKVNEVLKDESRGGTGLRIGRISKTLVTIEVGLSLALLVSAGLMIKSVARLRTADWGFDPANTFTARVALFEQDYPRPEDRRQLLQQLIERVEALPGVEAAGLTDNLPVGGSWGDRVAIEGKDYPTEKDYPETRLAAVTPGWFQVLGAPAAAGREFGREDHAENLLVAVVNQSFARAHFGAADPVGKRLRLGGAKSTESWRTIVGVVPDLYMDGPQNDEPAGIYLPLWQVDRSFISILARTAGEPMSLTAAVQGAVSSLDANTPIYFVYDMEQVIGRSTWFYSVFGSLFMIFGFVALFLAAIGLYGVMAFSVHQRSQEVGIRMALGAESRRVLGMILGQGGRQLVIGMALGLPLGLAFANAVEGFLFHVEPFDPSIFALIVTALTATGFAACYFPARRAAATHPMTALR